MLNSTDDQKQLGVIKINTFESMIVCIDKSCSSLLVRQLNGVYHKVIFLLYIFNRFLSILITERRHTGKLGKITIGAVKDR